MVEVLCLAGLIGVVGSVLAVVILSLMGKKAVYPLALFGLSVLVILGSGFLPRESSSSSKAAQAPASAQKSTPAPQPKTDASPVSATPSASNAAPAEPVSAPATVSGNSGGVLGDYYVEIKDASIVKDYDGDPAIVITYAWTNNSEDTTSAEIAFMEKAFQGGVQLGTAYIGKKDVYDSELSFKNLRPGATLDVQCAFLLRDESSVIEFELSEFLSLSDAVITKDFDPANLT